MSGESQAPNQPQEPVKQTETSIYGWTNERDHKKVLVYIPAPLRRHPEFPLSKEDDITIQIEEDEVVISSTE
jgi:hypothetical protein